MYRTILFRGKDETGEWRKGSLVLEDPYSDRGTAMIVTKDEQWPVSRESVGQYLAPIEDQEAFEGDYIHVDYEGMFEDGTCMGLLEWSPEGAMLDFGSQSIPLDAPCFEQHGMAIVGNVIDSPDLLAFRGPLKEVDGPDEPTF